MPYVEGAGVALHYVAAGEGPAAVVVVHAMGSDALVWEPVLPELAAASGGAAVALDRRGYGRSGAPEPYEATTVQEQAEDVAAVVDALEGALAPLLVGEGFGALVVLELLVRRRGIARGAVLLDTPLHAFVPAATAALADERTLLEQGLREGGPAAAVRAWLAEAGVGARSDSAPESDPGPDSDSDSGSDSGAGPAADAGRVERAVASSRGFFADYAGQSSWSPSRRELRSISVPVALVTGPATPAHVVAAADAAAALVPGGLRRTDGDAVTALRRL